MKSYILVLILIVVVVAGIALFSGDGASRGVLGEDVEIYAYTLDGETSAGGVVSVPFLAKRERAVVNILIDTDGDAAFDGEDEWAVRNARAVAREDYRNNFVYEGALSFGEDVETRVVLTQEALPDDWDRQAHEGEEVTVGARVNEHNLEELLGLNVPGAEPELKRGAAAGTMPHAWAAPEAQASSHVTPRSARREARTPDIRQGPMECSAVSTANNIISLVDENGRGRDLPTDDRELIEELKRDMQFVNGILDANFVDGKDAFAARHDLPIQTEQIDNPSWEDIFNALDAGAAVEMSMSFIRSQSGHPNTGHTVTAVGASQDSSGNQSIDVHDPATPPGMDSLDLPQRIRAGDTVYEGVEYPMWDGIAFIDTIFIQRWGTEVPEDPGIPPETEQARDQTLVQMLVIDGHYFPKHQFRVAEPDRCDADHYHADGSVYGLRERFKADVITMTDPLPRECGFGKVSEVPVESINITHEQSVELIKHIP